MSFSFGQEGVLKLNDGNEIPTVFSKLSAAISIVDTTRLDTDSGQPGTNQIPMHQ